MGSVRPELLWSPNLEDTFLTWSSTLQLYQTLDPEDSVGSNKFKLGEKYWAKPVALNNDYQYIKCVSWHHGGKEDLNQHLVAVGLANGKIALTNFSKQSDLNHVVGKEFVPKNSRQVNSLAWNPFYHQLLVGCFDRAGKDNSLVVIDLLQRASAPSSYFHDKPSSSGRAENLRSCMETSPGETVHSVEFARHDPQIILAGVNNRTIKLYDMRSPGKAVTSLNTKATFTIASDIFDAHIFASSFENVVHVWDVRNLGRSVLNLVDSIGNKEISKLSWCPTRRGFLASLPRDCSSFRLYDIHRTEAQKVDDNEPSVVTRSVSMEPSNSLISSFAWHPTHENRITIASYSGQLYDHVVRERVMIDFSSCNSVVWSSGKGNLSLLEDETLQQLDDDISFVIKKRAINGYGLQTKNLVANGEIANDPVLLNLWTWMEEGRKLTKDNSCKMHDGTHYKFHGILNVLSSPMKKSEVFIKPWIGVDGISKNNHIKTFRSDERSLALTLCSWGFNKNNSSLDNFVNNMESQGLFTRAAAVAVFNLNIPKAIAILQRGADVLSKPEFNSTAMALAGFTNDRKALWRETCSSLLKSITDPYIRATFAFLTGEGETFDPILRDPSITIQDQVAFACTFLSDASLIEYLKNLKKDLVKAGNLNGILLTGLDQDGLDLLQRYIDSTGDVQTASVVVIHAMQIEPESRPYLWVDQYRMLLNNLQLWKQRALLDVLKNSLSVNKIQKKTPQQLYISCHFCLKSISSYIQAPGRSRNPYAKYGSSATHKSKMSACPACHKPLPRCSLCLQHMGTPSKRGTSKALSVDDQNLHLNVNGDENSTKILSHFGYWFTWCQSCHHGGHTIHMIDWFKSNNECPVVACNCRCMEVDGSIKLGVSIAK